MTLSEQRNQPSVERDYCKGSNDLAAFSERSKDRLSAEAIARADVEELRKQKAKLAALESKIAAEEGAVLAKVARAEYLEAQVKKAAQELERGNYLHSEAQGVASGDTMHLCFSGHPNPAYQSTLGALTLGGMIAGAQQLIAAFPAWEQPRREALKAMSDELAELRKELNL